MGCSPLRLAIDNPSITFITILLEKGANPNTCHVGGLTELEFAIKWGRKRHINLLLKHGANPWEVDIEQRREKKYTINPSDCKNEGLELVHAEQKKRCNTLFLSIKELYPHIPLHIREEILEKVTPIKIKELFTKRRALKK